MCVTEVYMYTNIPVCVCVCIVNVCVFSLCVLSHLKKAEVSWDSLTHREANRVSRYKFPRQHVIQTALSHTDTHTHSLTPYTINQSAET